MSILKIAFDYQIFCSQSYGGISRYFVNLAEELNIRSEKAEVKIFAPWHISKFLSLMPNDVVSGTNVGEYPRYTRLLARNINRLESKRRIGKWNPQLLHETYYSKKSVSPKGCPVVCTVYDMIHEIFPEKFSADDKTCERKHVAISRADHVICISRNTQRDLIEILGVPESKTSVVHLGFQRLDKNVLTTERSAGENNFILYVGDRGGYKNFEKFVRSVASSPRLRSDVGIVAFGGGPFKTEELALIDGLGFSGGQVRQVTGDDDILGSLYSRARAFVYPSLYEGFGLPLLEAMAHNCPVISSNSSSMPEVIGDAAEYFDPGSVEEMSTAIENVLYSEQRMAELRVLGQSRLEHFSWKKCGEGTMAVYEKLARVG